MKSIRVRVRATVLALLIAGLGGFLLWTYLKRFEAEASGGPRIGVLATIRTLEPGAILRDEDIGERWVPQSYVETRAIRVSDRQRIANLRILAPLQAQQTLMWTDIVVANDDKHDLIAPLQPGMRAVTIRADGKASSLVRPGHRVDVIGIFSPPGGSDNRTGVVLLQNVLVLGRHSNSPGGTSNGNENADGNELALSLSLQNAQVLAVAADKGRLSVAVRPRDDDRIQDGLADFPSNSLVEAEKRAVAARVAGKQGPVKMDTAVTGAPR